MEKAKTLRIPESEVVKLWQHQLRAQRRLTDTSGSPVEVVYPGRTNDGRGGDFRDAVINTRQDRRIGCIEVHTRASGWIAHGHHLDPAYNQVVLHVALENDRPGQTRLQNGSIIPLVLVEKEGFSGAHAGTSESALPCQGTGASERQEQLGAILESAGYQRLEEKARRYQNVQSASELNQRLYQGFLEALGYTKNVVPFRELARQANLERLKNRFWNREPDIIRLQAWLLGQAGLLPSQRPGKPGDDPCAAVLEAAWAALTEESRMCFRDWELFKVRPGNYPVRRIIALSHLLHRYRHRDWGQSLLRLVDRVPEKDLPQRINAALRVAVTGYWSRHYDFGPAAGFPQAVLLGKERAAEIAVNVLLPLAWGESRRLRDDILEAKVRRILAGYPRLEENSIERHMQAQLSLNPSLVNSALRQQGLIQIYKTRCIQGGCGECIVTSLHDTRT